jgi:K+-transporting ATPase A subunit
MTLLFLPLVGLGVHSEQQGNPLIAKLGVDQAVSVEQPGGNMEGKESRFGGRRVRAVCFSHHGDLLGCHQFHA